MRENKKKFRNKINFFVFVSPRLTKIHLDVSFVRFKQIYWHTQFFFFFFSFNFLKLSTISEDLVISRLGDWTLVLQCDHRFCFVFTIIVWVGDV
jgi:hypothetical protein